MFSSAIRGNSFSLSLVGFLYQCPTAFAHCFHSSGAEPSLGSSSLPPPPFLVGDPWVLWPYSSTTTVPAVIILNSLNISDSQSGVCFVICCCCCCLFVFFLLYTSLQTWHPCFYLCLPQLLSFPNFLTFQTLIITFHLLSRAIQCCPDFRFPTSLHMKAILTSSALSSPPSPLLFTAAVSDPGSLSHSESSDCRGMVRGGCSHASTDKLTFSLTLFPLYTIPLFVPSFTLPRTLNNTSVWH